MAEQLRVLACICPVTAPDTTAYFDPTSSIIELASVPQSANVEVKVLKNASYKEFQDTLDEYKPTVVYIGAPADYEANKQAGSLQAFSFSDGASVDSLLGTFFAGKGIETLYIDAKTDFDQVKALQARGEVPNAIAWPTSEIPATIAAQFAHTFLSVLLTYASAPNEAYTMASHVVQAHCTTLEDGVHHAPALPTFLSSLKAELPDNNSIPAVDIPGMDPTQSIASLVPGWSDLRLLAPRAELRLLLCGGSSLIDSHKLSFLGEALRALLVMETRSITLISTSSCSKVPVNLAPGCAAMRCEVRTASGRPAIVVLGGQPEVLKDNKLVEHALRMTLVSDAQSLQFRLPPPGMAVPAPRRSAAIAGNTPVVDTLVLTSVWAVQVLRGLCQDAKSFGLITMGIAAVGASATAGVLAGDAQRLKMIVSGMGPSEHPAEPLPDATPLERAAVEAAGPAPALASPDAEQAPDAPSLAETPVPAPPPLQGAGEEEPDVEADMTPDQEGAAGNEEGTGMDVEAGGEEEQHEHEAGMEMEQ